MTKLNKKLFIESIKGLHPADQADKLESLPTNDQSSILKTHTKYFHPENCYVLNFGFNEPLTLPQIVVEENDENFNLNIGTFQYYIFNFKIYACPYFKISL